MSQSSAVIAKLQSALDCTGKKCDCCDGLQAQINDLRNQINTKIGQEEKPAIIQQSVASAEQLLVPGILLFVGNAVNGLRPEIAAAAAAASQAASTATAAATAAAGAIAQLAGMTAQIAAIFTSIATLAVLGTRIDAVESLALSIGNGLSEALSLIGAVKSTATRAEDLANEALRGVGDLNQYVRGLFSTISSQVDARIGALKAGLEGIIDARISELEGLIRGTNATLSEIIARLIGMEIQLPSLREILANLQSQVNGIFIRVRTLEDEITNTQERVGVLEGAITNTQERVGVLEGAIVKAEADIAVMWPSILAVPATIPVFVREGIQTFVPPLVQTLVPPAVQEVIPPLIQTIVPPIVEGSIHRVLNNWISVSLPSAVTNIVNNMTVDLSPVLQAIARVDVKVDNTFKLVKTIHETTTETKAVVYTVNNKVGPQILGGLSGWMIRFTGWAVLDRLMNLLTLATTIHNAQQLSSNIFITLITAIQNVFDFFGIKDSEGKIFSISSLIGQTATSLVTLIIGEENYTNFAKEWAKYNRTYQAAANLFSSLMNFGDTVTQALQVVSSQTGKIGNALRTWGVVSEKAYSWMNPNPNFSNPLLVKLTSLQETASMVENVSQQPLNIKSAKEEAETASKEFMDSLEQKDDSKQGPTIPEAKKVKTEQMEIVAASKGKDLAESDLTPDEDDI
jgi:chaperonin cofactor prefoldin